MVYGSAGLRDPTLRAKLALVALTVAWKRRCSNDQYIFRVMQVVARQVGEEAKERGLLGVVEEAPRRRVELEEAFTHRRLPVGGEGALQGIVEDLPISYLGGGARAEGRARVREQFFG